jgi:hypothetical protein
MSPTEPIELTDALIAKMLKDIKTKVEYEDNLIISSLLAERKKPTQTTK